MAYYNDFYTFDVVNIKTGVIVCTVTGIKYWCISLQRHIILNSDYLRCTDIAKIK